MNIYDVLLIMPFVLLAFGTIVFAAAVWASRRSGDRHHPAE